MCYRSLALAGTLAMAAAFTFAKAGPPAEFGTHAEHLAAEAEAERFSGVVLIARDGVPVFQRAYGYADRGREIPNRIDTKFNIGSINKMFTTIATYMLVEQGRLDLDDTIGKYLPQFPADIGQRVKIRHLLEHSSGWAAYWENPDYLARRQTLRSIDDYMSFIKDIPLEFEPGTSRQYSNTGYEVLGAIIEKVTGSDYFDFVREHIFRKAGMLDTDAYANDQPLANRAIGYQGGGYAETNADFLPARGTAAGGGYSTAEDLVRLIETLRSGGLVSRRHAARFLGGGFAGGGPGINAVIETAPEGHTIVVLSNFDPPGAEDLARAIVRDLPGGPSAPGEAALAFRIGMGFERTPDGIALVVEPGGPAAVGGLQTGDALRGLNGAPIIGDLFAQLDPLLAKPDPITFRILRDGADMDVVVTPQRTAGKVIRRGAPPPEEGGSPTMRMATAIVEFTHTKGNDAVTRFVKNSLSKASRERNGDERLVDAFSQIRDDMADGELRSAERTGPNAAKITLVSPKTGRTMILDFTLETTAPHRIETLSVDVE